MLEQLIAKFEKRSKDLLEAIADDQKLDEIQKLDDSINASFQEILDYHCSTADERNRQIKFFTGLLEKQGNDTVYRLAIESVNALLDRYVTDKVKKSAGQQTEAADKSADLPDESSSITIVIVDDSPEDIYLTKLTVEKEGFVNKCLSVRNPKELIGRLDALVQSGRKPEELLILLDIKMPGINGIDLLKQLRSHSVYEKTAVIMLSGSNNEQDKTDSSSHGSDGYMVKPIDGGEFYESVTNIPAIKHQLLH